MVAHTGLERQLSSHIQSGPAYLRSAFVYFATTPLPVWPKTPRALDCDSQQELSQPFGYCLPPSSSWDKTRVSSILHPALLSRHILQLPTTSLKMCETQYYNTTYPNGERALVEQIKPCRHRCYESPSWALKDRVPTPYYADHKQLPSDKERRRERRYSDAGRYYQDKDYSPRRRNSLQASQPIDIPARKPRRSSTMYEDNGYYTEQKHESRRRSEKPIIVERESRDRGHRSSRRESAAVPLGWEALYYGSPSRREDKYKSRDSYLEPGRTTSHRRHSSSPTEIHRSDDRHRSSRRSRHEKPVVTSDGPVTNADILYGDSPIGSYGSYNSHHSRTSTPLQSPPKSPVFKGVRWEDEVRAAQNQRISSRPRLSRSGTISGAGTGRHQDGEVKGILKTTNGSGADTSSMPMMNDMGASAPAVQPLHHEMESQLYQSMEGLGIEDHRPSSSQGKQQRAAATDYFEHMDGMGDRLRSRISASKSSPSRRPTSSSSSFLDSTPRGGAWGEKASSGRSSRRTPERFYADYSTPDYIY